MHRRIVSSRQRFQDYLKSFQERQRAKEGHSATPTKTSNAEANLKPLQQTQVRSSWELIRQFFVLMKPYRSPVYYALATLTVSTILGLIPPAATKFVVDYVLVKEKIPDWLTTRFPLLAVRWNLLLFITLAAFGISVLKTVIHLWGRWYATKATKSMQMAIRRKSFAHAMRLPLHRVYELKSGGVASILREDAGSVGDLIFGMVYNPWRAAIQLLGSLCVLAWVDWRLLLGTLVLIPAVYFTHRTWVKQIRPRYRDVRNRRTDVDGKAAESFGGMRVVRAFSGQRAETSRFMNTNHLLGRQELNTWLWARSMEVVWGFLIPVGCLSVLLYGGWQVETDRLTLGDLMMFLTYLLFLLEPITVLAQSATQFQNSLSGLDRILDLLAEPREMPPTPDSITFEKSQVRGQIQLENVSFQYPGSQEFALQNISFTAEPGQTVALVGPSGAGKTTLCNLVARFYDPSEGRVLLDGHNLRDIEVENFRSLLGLVE
ncbi:MAG: ABC transporter ATP-binding protein, partial [Planctomycetaceae bacterium]|nr:ABC transporter ATP-binding protein [Planctomycetaceae bacterium]